MIQGNKIFISVICTTLAVQPSILVLFLAFVLLLEEKILHKNDSSQQKSVFMCSLIHKFRKSSPSTISGKTVNYTNESAVLKQSTCRLRVSFNLSAVFKSCALFFTRVTGSPQIRCHFEFPIRNLLVQSLEPKYGGLERGKIRKFSVVADRPPRIIYIVF